MRNFHKQIDNCKRHLELLRERRDKMGFREFGIAKRNYLGLLAQQHFYWKQWAKFHWLRNGDQNLRFYHESVCRRRRNNQVTKLKNDDGAWIQKGPELDRFIGDYFGQLYASTQVIIEDVLECITKRITSNQNSILTRAIDGEEAKQAVFNMHPDKSLGPNSLNPGFYQAYWDVLGGDIVDMCNQFLLTCQLQQGLNDTNLVIIPKTSNPQSVRDLRSIALYNVMYKILTKILANRLKEVLSIIISKNQSAFIIGRSITYNIIVSYETQHYIRRKNQGQK